MAQFAKPRDLVLVVEDEALVRMNSADVIRNLAVSLLESVPGITVLFTDVQMPGSMDGLLLAAVVRDRWPPIGLLITSGKLDHPTADVPTGAGFISKPYSPLELKDQLYSLTGRC